MTVTVPDIWRTGDTEQLARMMADDAVFSSPVADYQGVQARHIVGLIAQVLGQVETTHQWSDGAADTVIAFTARVRDDPMDGLVRERRDAHGALTHVTLFLRPLHTLEEAITHIRALRKQNPTPGPPSGGTAP